MHATVGGCVFLVSLTKDGEVYIRLPNQGQGTSPAQCIEPEPEAYTDRRLYSICDTKWRGHSPLEPVHLVFFWVQVDCFPQHRQPGLRWPAHRRATAGPSSAIAAKKRKPKLSQGSGQAFPGPLPRASLQRKPTANGSAVAVVRFVLPHIARFWGGGGGEASFKLPFQRRGMTRDTSHAGERPCIWSLLKRRRVDVITGLRVGAFSLLVEMVSLGKKGRNIFVEKRGWLCPVDCTPPPLQNKRTSGWKRTAQPVSLKKLLFSRSIVNPATPPPASENCPP